MSVSVGWQVYDITRNPFFLGLVGLAQSPLVIGQDVNGLTQGAIKDIGLVAQVAASAGNEQQTRSGAGTFVIEAEIIQAGYGHGSIPWLSWQWC